MLSGEGNETGAPNDGFLKYFENTFVAIHNKSVRSCDEENTSSARASEAPNLPGSMYDNARKIDSTLEAVSGLCRTNSRYFAERMFA